MKIFFKTILVLSLMLPLLVSAQVNEMKTSDNKIYVIRSSHNTWEEAFMLPFLVNANAASIKLFENPVFAIKIHEIVVDGLQIEGTLSHEFIDDINFKSFSIANQVFIYKVASNNMLFASALRSKGDFDLVSYMIPKSSKEVIVVYQLRNADGLIGPTLTLKSVALD